MLGQYVVAFISLGLLQSCAKESTKKASKEVQSSDENMEDEKERTVVSKSTRLFTQSLKNNPLSSFKVNRRAAADAATDIYDNKEAIIEILIR